MEEKQSFAQMTKIELCTENVKRKCCRRSLLLGLLMYSKRFNPESSSGSAADKLIENLIAENERQTEDKRLILDVGSDLQDYSPKIDRSIFLCSECARRFIRGAFISCGTITNPGRGYRAEMIIQNKKEADELAELLAENGVEPKMTQRSGSYVLYFKEIEKVEDFLRLIGAQKALFVMMNTNIYRELRNNANRLTNCETANIDKSLCAALNQASVIKTLRDKKLLCCLPKELRVTAELRLQYPDKSLEELAYLHGNGITKSGVYHRLQKIMAFAQKTPEKNNLQN